VLRQPQFPPQEPDDGLEPLVRRALEARLSEGGRVGEGREADGNCFVVGKSVFFYFAVGSKRWDSGCDDVPLAIPNSPAVSSARVASLGRFSRTTEAAMVMGRAASWSSASASGGAEEGEGEGDGDGEGIVSVGAVVFFSAFDAVVR
jgi:hypothetical protein